MNDATAKPAGAAAHALRPRVGDALLLVDLQRDFLPGGALAVADGDAVVGPLNAVVARFAAQHLPIVASRDWHPPDHCSFGASGGPWPPHCVAGSDGAAFAPSLVLPDDVRVVSKGTTPEQEAYSAFDGTALEQSIRELGVHRLFVGGLATDYCVRASVLDALRLGHAVVLLTDAVRAVDVHPDDGRRALDEMREAGAWLARSSDLA